MTNRPFQLGDRVFNTGNKTRKTIGIVTNIIDADWCEVLWSNGEGYVHRGTIRRDGTVEYTREFADIAATVGRTQDRIVRVTLSVHIPNEEVC